MKILVRNANEIQLDWLVSTCEGWEYDEIENAAHKDRRLQYCTNKAQSEPIIEREKITTYYQPALEQWAANHDGNVRYGATRSIAAMRAYVTSKLGNKVWIPDELSGRL